MKKVLDELKSLKIGMHVILRDFNDPSFIRSYCKITGFDKCNYRNKDKICKACPGGIILQNIETDTTSSPCVVHHVDGTCRLSISIVVPIIDLFNKDEFKI